VSEIEALQKTLAAEHAAVYVFGALGAQTSESTFPRLFADLTAAYTQHRARRDFLVRVLTDLREVPVAAEPAYELADDLATPQTVSASGLDLERACARTYAYLVASTTQGLRRWAIGALTQTAVRELAFRGTPEMFPGSEYADR